MSKEEKEKAPNVVAGADPLLEGEDLKIVITKRQGGGIATIVKYKEGAPFNFFEVMGVIQASVHEAFTRNAGQRGMVAPPPQEMVKFTIDETDIELDVTGQLKILGLSLGDEIEVTKAELMMREQTRAAFLAGKENKKEEK